jgi:hypothetical protein
MTHTQILTSLSTLSEDELRSLNRAVIDQLKAIRNKDAALKRHLFKAGDKVSWSGRRGYTEGVIVRVKRKKAIVDVIGSGAFGSSWDVPLNMLSAA